MKKGLLSNYFHDVAFKRLSSVESDPNISHQHEFNGVNSLRRILGTEEIKYPAKFIFLGENDEDKIIEDGFVTWYDARLDHPQRTEYRLYYSSLKLPEFASPGDLLIIGKLKDISILIIIIRSGTTYENNLLWLFGIPEEQTSERYQIEEISKEKDKELGFAARLILEELGIDVIDTDDTYLDQLIKNYGDNFPATREFSRFARQITGITSLDQDPDFVLVEWMDSEELLFRTFEKYFIQQQINNGFSDVDSFIKVSLSIQNRRKSRAGYALENHIEALFLENEINYSRGKTTENNSKPDFIFPSITHYNDEHFSENLLTMLAVKSTCKDRWRQILTEANRIKYKHLLTLEPGISVNQTNEMASSNVKLVIPKHLFLTYKEYQYSNLLNVKGFLDLVKNKQKNIDI